jgi:hypothetical protein
MSTESARTVSRTFYHLAIGIMEIGAEVIRAPDFFLELFALFRRQNVISSLAVRKARCSEFSSFTPLNQGCSPSPTR